MSKHISRNKSWTEITNQKHITYNGYVEQNERGKWDAVVTYMNRPPLPEDHPFVDPLIFFDGVSNHLQIGQKQEQRKWSKRQLKIGEYKRSREAKMAVEQKVEEIRKKNNPDVLL